MTHTHGSDGEPVDIVQFWQSRYGDAGHIWSGRPNEALVAVAADLAPGRALDLGCGEGGDAIWLATRGWEVTGVDVSTTALGRAQEAAQQAGVPEDRIRWIAHELTSWTTDEEFDLVTAAFLHSPVEIPRTAILRRAAEHLVPGGHLLVVSHAAPPPWADDEHDHPPTAFPTPEEEVADLGLDGAAWDVLVAETRRRETTGPDERHAVLDDGVVLARRRGAAGPL